MKTKLIAVFAAAGIGASTAFVANDLTLPLEGFSTTVYKDPVGLPTVCVGHMDKTLRQGESFSLDECMQMFAEDWKKHEQQLNSVVTVPFKSEWEKAALTDFTFNVGIGSVQSSTLIKLLNQGKHKEACQQLIRWNKAQGRVLKGLVVRRRKELQYCLGEIPRDKQQEYQEFLKEYEATNN